MALLEAASSGLPCVATDTGGVGEMGAGRSGPRPGNAEALARAMTRIMACLPKSTAQEMGLAARAQVVGAVRG